MTKTDDSPIISRERPPYSYILLGLSFCLAAFSLIIHVNGNLSLIGLDKQEYDPAKGALWYWVRFDCPANYDVRVAIQIFDVDRVLGHFEFIDRRDSSEIPVDSVRANCRNVRVRTNLGMEVRQSDPGYMSASPGGSWQSINLDDQRARGNFGGYVYRAAFQRKSLGEYEGLLDIRSYNTRSSEAGGAAIVALWRDFDAIVIIPQPNAVRNIWMQNQYLFASNERDGLILLRVRNSDVYDLRDFYNALAAILASLGVGLVFDNIFRYRKRIVHDLILSLRHLLAVVRARFPK